MTGGRVAAIATMATGVLLAGFPAQAQLGAIIDNLVRPPGYPYYYQAPPAYVPQYAPPPPLYPPGYYPPVYQGPVYAPPPPTPVRIGHGSAAIAGRTRL